MTAEQKKGRKMTNIKAKKGHKRYIGHFHLYAHIFRNITFFTFSFQFEVTISVRKTFLFNLKVQLVIFQNNAIFYLI